MINAAGDSLNGSAFEPTPLSAMDMELIGQRIAKLAEIAVLEHMDALMRSQADGLRELVETSDRSAATVDGWNPRW